jgi:hypothetical protein
MTYSLMLMSVVDSCASDGFPQCRTSISIAETRELKVPTPRRSGVISRRIAAAIDAVRSPPYAPSRVVHDRESTAP